MDLQQLSDRPSSGVPATALTERQREIAALIVEGLTNQAIADRLGMARALVSQHVATILWRLGVTNRNEIAVWAIKQECHTYGRGPAAPRS
jgi:DNA-binding NarL/FixJ family response regulator